MPNIHAQLQFPYDRVEVPRLLSAPSSGRFCCVSRGLHFVPDQLENLFFSELDLVASEK